MRSLPIIKELLKTQIKLWIGRGVFYSYAQNGEDAVINVLTKKTKNGVYVDVGGFHPVQYSNTYSLYKRGWKGIVVEPNPRAKSLFSFFRPKDDFVHSGVGSKQGSLTYFNFSDPAYNTFDETQAEESKKRVNLVHTSSVPITTLKKILNDRNISKIDVLSIDVEGMDLDVLRSHDWTISTNIIVVESSEFDIISPSNDPMYVFLRSKGYELVAALSFSLVFKQVHSK
jgi:FkbM family methyltransferase